MAAGRGEFLMSFLEGLRRNPNPNCDHAAPARRKPFRKPGPGEREPGPRGDEQTGGKGRSQSTAAPSSVGGNIRILPKIKEEENLIERLPAEILLKILSYLDASALSCIGHVSKIFHRLAADDVIWQKIYASDFGSQTWRPKPSAADAALQVDLVAEEDRPAGRWKKKYFRTMVGPDVNKWWREMRDVRPHTGLPRMTEWALRELSVSWELTVGAPGQEVTMTPSRVRFLDSSAVVHFSEGRLPRYSQIRSIQLHGVRKEAPRGPRAPRPGWRSLILKLEVTTRHSRFLGSDGLITLRQLQPGVAIGSWSRGGAVAFITVTLHFHKLVERSLLGSPACPYADPPDRPPADHCDPEFGLSGYSLHFVLHDTNTQIMSGNFCCHTVQVRGDLVELRVIAGNEPSQHKTLRGNIQFPWRTQGLLGSVERCCLMTLTLLDGSQKPFWCVSSPVSISGAKRPPSSGYGGRHFQMRFQEPEGGRVRMELVWLEEQRQFFVIGLAVYLPVGRVHERLSRED